jgi:RNA polymerase sigma factor (sigma-70 family)
MGARVWIDSPALPRLVARIAADRCLRESDLQDLIQETRIALWEAGAEKNVTTAWVSRVAMNKAVDLVRRTIRARAREHAYACRARGGEREPEIECLLRARVSEIPVRLRDFYDLHYVQGWSERELAKRLGRCRASIRWLDRLCRRAIVGKPRGVDP